MKHYIQPTIEFFAIGTQSILQPTGADSETLSMFDEVSSGVALSPEYEEE